jgi:transcriptional regulator with XRE-family HTH domain
MNTFWQDETAQLPPEAETFQVRIGKRFKQMRAAKRLPLKWVAAHLRVSIATVSSWERGIRFPSAFHLVRLSEFYKIPLCQFFRPNGAACSFPSCADNP